jgi:hypothetical protein
LEVVDTVHDDPLTVSVDEYPPCETVPTGWHPQKPMPASSTGVEQQALPPLLLLLLLLHALRRPTKTATKPNAFRIWLSPRGSHEARSLSTSLGHSIRGRGA